MDDLLMSARFPRASAYHPEWVLAGVSGGANPLWLTEWLAEAMDLRPGMRVLDLGCGRALSSVFLRREFGAQVWAADLWFSPSENLQRVRDAGAADGVFPLRADARALPFAAEFFDAVVTLLLSESGDIAKTFLAAIKAELTDIPALAAAYPGACGEGPVWQADRVVLRNGCSVVARGAGGRIRGLKSGAARPTLIVLDDPNEKTDAFSPTTRRRKLDWVRKDVLSAGGPTTNFVCLGTPLHREAIVCELLRAGAWQGRSYRSIVRYPDRLDRWAEWERAVTNLADPDRLATARAFYDAHRAEMDAGAEVLWPEREGLYALMLHRADIGPAAFDSEKQDQPGTDGASEWPAAYFDRPDLWFREWPAGLLFRCQALDPSKGAASRAGDYQAHVRGGLDRRGTIYLEADLRRT